MRIIVDKVDTEPYHSLTKIELKSIVNLMSKYIDLNSYSFRLSAQLYKFNNWPRPVICNNNTFNILSRSFEKKEIIEFLIIEILKQNQRIGIYNKGHILTNSELKELKVQSSIFLQEIVTKIN